MAKVKKLTPKKPNHTLALYLTDAESSALRDILGNTSGLSLTELGLKDVFGALNEVAKIGPQHCRWEIKRA